MSSLYFAIICLVFNFLIKVFGEGPMLLDSKYSIQWDIDLENSRIYFQSIVETVGYVGFGLSSNGQMNGADIFIAGVVPINWTYAMDMHGVGHTLVRDDVNDWHLTSASENSTHTHLSFWRELNTCDLEDVAITNDTVRIIWSYGASDDITYHGEGSRGTTSTNFLAPPQPVWDPSRYSRFDVTINFTMPAEETTYWCSLHRGPRVTAKSHIVAFEASLNNDLARIHTHHFVLMMCNAPPGLNATELFEPHVGRGGHLCYDVPEFNPLPMLYCQEYLYVWAVGGRPTRFQELVGYPFGDSGTEVYYLLEVHYDNPRRTPGLTFVTGVSIYHTAELREVDAGLMWTPYDNNPSLIIPPETTGFTIRRKMKFRHFRDGIELEWIMSDGNYDFNFQQSSDLWEERTVLPGDQLTVECVFDSTGRNNTVIAGGFSTREEMCEAIFWYYPKIPLVSCGSIYPFESALAEYGVTNYTLIRNSTYMTVPWIWAPESLAGSNGMDLLTSLNTRYNWTLEFIDFMRQSRQFGQHLYHCLVDGEDAEYGNVRYPQLEQEYQPINPCV
ncbi:DBH-like monooxygenase protein 2 [Folsomia candida]|uniref:DBH-like monooxygenase protein 2 n=1 Tax=Folsomia candida TaxID=158441 RepID=A0A226D1W6_FOLCA|nr:DBH-like monooxygenase protein 2 [Folsomia candida]